MGSLELPLPLYKNTTFERIPAEPAQARRVGTSLAVQLYDANIATAKRAREHEEQTSDTDEEDEEDDETSAEIESQTLAIISAKDKQT